MPSLPKSGAALGSPKAPSGSRTTADISSSATYTATNCFVGMEKILVSNLSASPAMPPTVTRPTTMASSSPANRVHDASFGDKDGLLRVVASQFDGKKFNSPNDVVVKSDNSVWFTDPTYGLPKDQDREIKKQGVYRVSPEGKVTCVVDDFDQPNGLCFSPDEKRLYIADSGKPHHIRVFDVEGETLKNSRIVCVIDTGVPDGMRCDGARNIWSSAGDGVQVFSPDGNPPGKIPVPESPANLCFGGADGNRYSSPRGRRSFRFR